MAENSRTPIKWLQLQEVDRYKWQRLPTKSSDIAQGIYYRRLGVVESLFDEDGTAYCGRADLHQNYRMEIKTSLSDHQLRERIVLAWTLMRHSHILLSCRSVHLHDLLPQSKSLRWTDKCFIYQWPKSVAAAIEQVRGETQFVADEYNNVDSADFFHHLMNTARALNADEALSKLYVMPFKKTEQGTTLLHIIPVLAHQITDGLTTFRWYAHFSQILNFNEDQIRAALEPLFSNEDELIRRFPPAQEALYPLRSHSPARTRWHWLLTRILRHVRIPPPASFQNPLRRVHPLTKAKRFPAKYDRVLDYSIIPPLNAGQVGFDITGRAAENIRTLCRQAGISIGSGCFTLVALVMTYIHEKRHPLIPLSQRLPFVGSFPVNPRPFFSGEPTTGKENSCMLAFSDGVTLPFLPSDLDLAGRFKILGRLAHRQLRQYQKRKQSAADEIHMGSRSPSQLIPALFCSTLERMENRVAAEAKAGVNVQGKYPAKVSPTLATCGISSVGDQGAVLAQLKVDLTQPLSGDSRHRDILADFRGLQSVVRPRDGEFLVGAIGNQGVMGFGVAYDANAIDPERVAEWKELMETMLDFDLEGSNLNLKLAHAAKL